MNRYPPVPPNRILLVEGLTDSGVISQICERNHPMPEFSISDKEGIDRLMDSIRQEVREPDREVVGIVVDRDTNLSARWDAVTHRLRVEGFTPPKSPDPVGTIIPEKDDKPRIGIWLMPDNQSLGELEDFVSEMIPSDDCVWTLSQCYVNGIPEKHRKFRPNKTQRAKVYAWLATRRDPRPMGGAVQTGDLRTDNDLCQEFVSWLRRLFG